MGARRVRGRLHACCSPSSSPTRRGCGTASTTGSRTGSPSTGPGRGEKEWYFYIVVLFAEEWPALLLGAVGAVAALRRPTLLRAVPDLGLRALARGLLLGERAVLVARAAPAAAAAAAGRARRAGDLGRARARWPAGSGSSSCAVCARYVGLHVVVGERRERRRPARVPRRRRSRPSEVKGVRDEVRRGRRARASARAATLQHPGRLGRGRDVPVGVVLPRPAGRLPRPDARRELPSDTDVRDPHRGQPRPAAADSSPATTGARFPFRVWWVRDYGAMSPGGVVALVHPARAVEPDRRDAGVALRPAGRLTRSASSPIVPSRVVHAPPELRPTSRRPRRRSRCARAARRRRSARRSGRAAARGRRAVGRVQRARRPRARVPTSWPHWRSWPGPAEHGRQPGERRDARVAEGGVVVADRLEHDRARRRVVVEPVDRADVARRAVAQPAEAVERRRAREAALARVRAGDRVDERAARARRAARAANAQRAAAPRQPRRAATPARRSPARPSSSHAW